MYVHLGYQIYKRRSFQLWIKSCLLVLVGYLLLAIIIWFVLYKQDNLPIEKSVIAAPIVVEIALLPSSTKIINNISDEQKQPIMAAAPKKVVAPQQVSLAPSLIAVDTNSTTEVANNKSKKKVLEKNTKTQQNDLENKERVIESRVDVKNNANVKVQAQDASNNSFSSENTQEQVRAPKVGSFNSEISDASEQRWENQVLAKLQKMKRYPAYAQHMGQQDIIMIKIVINSKGMLLDSSITQSQKMEVLENEVRALVKRAQPYPLPPITALVRDRVALEVPVEFFLK